MPINTKEAFRALADETRLRSIMLLKAEGELCVCELTHALDLPQPKISHHLGALRKAGLVQDRKEGLWVYYRLNDSLPGWLNDVVAATTSGLSQQSPFADDLNALRTMANRPGSACCA